MAENVTGTSRLVASARLGSITRYGIWYGVTETCMSPSFSAKPSAFTMRWMLCESLLYDPMPMTSGFSRSVWMSFCDITYSPTMRRASRT